LVECEGVKYVAVAGETFMMVSCAFLMRCAVMCKQIRSRAVNLADSDNA